MTRSAPVLSSLLLLGIILWGGASGEESCAPPCVPSPSSASPSNPPDVQVIAEGGVWTWFNDERAVMLDSTLFVGYVNGSGQSSVTLHPLGEAGPRRTSLSSFQEVDDHDNPAFLTLDDGRLLAAYSMHSEETHWYWRTKEPGTFQWTPEQRTASVGADVTYNNLFQLSDEEGRIYNFFRGINFDPTLMRSEDGGATWGEPTHFIESGGGRTRPYVKYVSNGEDRIDLLYTQGHPQELDAQTNVYHLYYQDGTLHESDGTDVCSISTSDCLPVTYSAGTLVYQATAEEGRGWVWDLEYAENGTPVGVYTTKVGKKSENELYYHYARYNPEREEWQEHRIAAAGSQLYGNQYHYSGGISVDPNSPDSVYISANVNPETGVANETGRYQLYRGATADGGATWNWVQLTQTSASDNLRPFVVRSTAADPVVLWFRGQYNSYRDYDTDIVGMIGGRG